MSRILRRGLATVSDAASSAAGSTSGSSSSTSSLRTPAQALAASKRTTAPLAVTRRRESYPDSIVQKRGTTPEQEKRFQAARAVGELAGPEVEARREFLRGQEEWRSRIRGHRQVLRMPRGVEGTQEDAATDADGGEPKLSTAGQMHLYEPSSIPPSTALSAQRIYLPNIQIRLMRNHTPPDQPYDTSIATFRIPPSMTKTDLRSYLFAVYGLKVTFIRTDNYLAPVARTPLTGQFVKIGGSRKNYKRAIVGLTEPFHYPDDMDELNAIIAYDPATSAFASTSTSTSASVSTDADFTIRQVTSEEVTIRRERALLGKERREQWLNAQFMVDLQDSGKKRSMMKLGKGVRWRSKTHDNDGNIVRAIMKRRKDQERSIEDAVRGLDLEDARGQVGEVAAV